MSRNTFLSDIFQHVKKNNQRHSGKAKNSLDSSIGTQVQILYLGAGVPGLKPALSRNHTIHIPGKNLVPSIWYH